MAMEVDDGAAATPAFVAAAPEARPDATEHPPSGALLDAPGGGGSAALFAEQSAADAPLARHWHTAGTPSERP